MKKILTVLLAVLRVMSLLACGSSEKTATEPAATPNLRVGYGRVCTTPKNPVALSHTQQPTYSAVFEDVYVTCVAISDAQDNTLLLLTADLSHMTDTLKNGVLKQVSEATGVPQSNISFSVTHNHSGVDPSGSMLTFMKDAAEESAVLAMEDRSAAELYAGATNTEGMNFVRHYTTADGYWVGDNYYSPTGSSSKEHEREPDTTMQLMNFVREGKKNVLMINWQAHGVYTYFMEHLCADFVGPFRTEVEKSLDCYTAYYQGAAGNLNPISNLAGHNVAERTLAGMITYGKALAQYPIKAVGSLEKVETGAVEVASTTYTATVQNDSADIVMAAANYRAAIEAGKTDAEAVVASGNLIHGMPGATRVMYRPDLGQSTDIPISAASVGDIAFVMAPYEMFDDSGVAIREGSPYKMTFILGYTNGNFGYFPSKPCCDHGCYEQENGSYVAGTAEELVTCYIDLLNQMSK